jgi:hypothetical protein
MVDNRDLVSSDSYLPDGINDRWKRTEVILDETRALSDVFGERGHTDWSLEHLTVSEIMHPWRRLRQICAELDRRRMALSEAKYNIMRKRLKIDKLNHKLSNNSVDEFKKRAIIIDIADLEDQIEFTMVKFSGAMRDVEFLYELYIKLRDKYGEPSIEESEKVQLEANLCRAITQSMWDIRSTGRISQGNQEYLQQCGVSPDFISSEIINFYNSKYKDAGINAINTFINNLTIKCVCK